MKSFKEYQEGAGLWANIHKKRKEGRPMRKPGSKGAPTKQDFERSRKDENVDEALVSGNRNIVKAILNKLEDYFADGLSNDDEKKMMELNLVAKHVRMGVTRKRQAKGKAFLYKLKKWNLNSLMTWWRE